jgi:hypothetical protein
LSPAKQTPVAREKRFAENSLNKEKDLATKDPVVVEERSAASTISPPTIGSETIDSETIDSGGGSMDELSNTAKDIYELLNVEESAIKHLEKKDPAATEGNDAAESAATFFNSCSTSSITNVPTKKCVSSSSRGVLQMQMKMFVLVLFFCLMHGSFAFEGPARHYDGDGDSGGDDRIIATKDQTNETSFDLDYGSACSLASSRTADLVSRSRCSVSNDATATLDCIDAVAAKRAIMNATLLADMLHAFSTSDSNAINLDSNGETCRSIDSADVFDRENEIDDGSNGYGKAARRFDDDDAEKLTDCPLCRIFSLTELNSIDVQKDGAVGLNVDDITLTSTLASVEFNVKLEKGT